MSIADENDSDLQYSEVPLKGKNKTLVKILGGRRHRTTHAGQILGGRNPCSVDAYAAAVLKYFLQCIVNFAAYYSWKYCVIFDQAVFKFVKIAHADSGIIGTGGKTQQ